MKKRKTTILAWAISSLLLLSSISYGNDAIRFQQNALAVTTTSYGGFLVDRDGFVWIASTGLGVYRYDGYELKSFAKSMQGSMVSSIVEDNDGLIWMASFSNGITCYDKETGKFISYRHNPKIANGLCSNNISFSPQKLCVSKSNELWVGTDDAGVCVYNKSTKTWRQYAHNPNDYNSLSDDDVMAICQGNDGIIWIGTQSGGLNRLDPKTGAWKRYSHNPNNPASLSSDWINAILEDKDGVLWIGTKNGGLNRFNKKDNTFSHYLHDTNDPHSIGGNEVWSMHEGHSGGIWICHLSSPSSGLEYFDTKSETFTRYSHNSSDTTSISSNAIASVYQDRKTETLWVINYDGHIDRQQKNKIKFRHWQGAPETANKLSDKSILPIIEDSDGIIWVGTFVGGLNRIDRANGTISHYLPDPLDDRSIPRARVTALAEDSQGVLWIGFWDGILASFDKKNGKCISVYKHDPSNPHSITQSERIKYILEDKDDPEILWITTIKGGLDRLNKNQKTFTHYKHVPKESNNISYNSVVTLYDDGKGVLWIPTYGGGLDRFDKKTGTFKNYRHQEGNPTSLGSDTLYEIIKTREGELWLSRKGGFSHFDPEKGTFKNYDHDADGVPLGAVATILQDNQGDLWLSTVGRGLVRFNPATKVMKRFTVEDGLQGNTFFWASRLKAKNGELWFGGSNGISSFNPKEIVENPNIPTIVLTAFTQGGQHLQTGTSPERLREVTLDWRSNYFEFQFSALDFTAPEKNQYAYMLEGWDEQWYHAGSNPFGRYSGLAGGRYTLRLKGTNNNGIWNDIGTSITVIVKPPFWKTTWFYCGLFLLAFIIVLAILFYVVKLRKEIFERKQAEERLVHLQSYLSDIIDSMPSVLLGVDNEGKITQWNSEAKRTTGITSQAAIGQPLHDVFPRFAVKLERVKESMQNHKTLVSDRQVHIEDGQKCYENVTIYPLIAKGIQGAVIRVDDITEQVRIEEMIIQSEKMLSIGGLAAGMAHEINNPLGGMMQTASVVKDRLTNLELSANQTAADEVGVSLEGIGKFMRARGIITMLERIIESGGRAATIVENMLSFAYKSDATYSSQNMAELIKQSIELASSDYNLLKKYDFRQIKIDYQYEDDIPDVQCEPSKIQQVLLNILRNGAEAMQDSMAEHPETKPQFIIRLAHEKDAATIRIEIQDNGPGINEGIRKRIFEPFFTTKPTNQGTGLGLSVSYFIITKNHHGQMSVESSVDMGTKFIIKLPLVQK